MSQSLTRFIKSSTGEKVESKTRSVNITAEHHAFLEREFLNLSLIVRQVLDGLMSESSEAELNKYRLIRGRGK